MPDTTMTWRQFLAENGAEDEAALVGLLCELTGRSEEEVPLLFAPEPVDPEAEYRRKVQAAANMRRKMTLQRKRDAAGKAS